LQEYNMLDKRIKKQRELTQSYAERVLYGRKNKDDSEPCIGIQQAKEVIYFHSEELEILDKKEAEVVSEISRCNDDITVCNIEIAKLKNETIKENLVQTRTITIILNFSSLNECRVSFSYVVTNATWTPSYDIRVNTVQGTLDLHYFAEVTQRSGEDWSDTNLQLSTSNPAIGSTPPALQKKTVIFSALSYRYKPSNNVYLSNNLSGSYSDRGSFAELPEETAKGAMGLSARETKDDLFPSTGLLGTGDAGSTSFSIQRKVNIASDSKPHKVTVTMATLSPQLVHYVAPSTSAFVYLQAKVQNTTSYPLLASDKVSVFLDGNFISTTSIGQANSTEYFNVYLGVDPAIKIDYLPCRNMNRVKGWLGGTEERKYFYSTVIHNTKQFTCKIIVVEVLPHSPDEKIVVELLEPPVSSLLKPNADAPPITSEQDFVSNLDSFGAQDESRAPTAPSQAGGTPVWPKDFTTLNKHTNHVVWLKTVAPGEKVEVKFTYRIMWPQGQPIEIV
jgi:uncharacterized protein (TIGR02231 family)